jgi:sulfur carrier protein
LRKVLKDEKMKLTINGKDSDVADGLTVSQILTEQDVKMPEMVSVELNGKILKRSEFESTTLNEGDKVEFLYFMGGGGEI